jgi:hypothetical protein
VQYRKSGLSNKGNAEKKGDGDKRGRKQLGSMKKGDGSEWHKVSFKLK